MPVRILEEGLNETINGFCEGNDEPLAIVMADLALADRSAILTLLTSGGDLAIAPGRGGEPMQFMYDLRKCSRPSIMA